METVGSKKEKSLLQIILLSLFLVPNSQLAYNSISVDDRSNAERGFLPWYSLVDFLPNILTRSISQSSAMHFCFLKYCTGLQKGLKGMTMICWYFTTQDCHNHIFQALLLCKVIMVTGGNGSWDYSEEAKRFYWVIWSFFVVTRHICHYRLYVFC